MSKKILASALMAFGLLSAAPMMATAADLKVGMVTDSGSIDDKSFNQGTWEGIKKATKDLGVKSKYLKPGGTTEADYVKEISNLNDAGFGLIVTPGFKFESAIFVAQDKYPKTKFVLIDGSPNNGVFDATRKEKVGANTVSIFFAEHESGFLAGVASALQIKEGDFGFIGGMEIPPVQKFNWGFQQGVAYANKNLGTKIGMKPENVIYQGTFHDVAAGQHVHAHNLGMGEFERDYGIGAQILRDLGVGKMKLLASPRRMPSMTGFDLEVTGYADSHDESR